MNTDISIIECVPNFSEGRDKNVIKAIANAISDTDGCSLLDIDSSESTNRTVYTFVGSQTSIIQGAFNAAKEASKHIDMTRHKGEHPRLGALDVCPFIPVRNATMDTCIICAREFSQMLADHLEVPVYLYGYAAYEDYRRTIPQIRAGEYEGLAEKLKDDRWKPDFGPDNFVSRWGATIVGARNFLIAYNVNLIGTKEQAHRIALDLRESGRGADKPGRLQKVQAIGWYLKENDLAQISANLSDYNVTSMHVLYEEVVTDAKKLNLPVVGSQIVGVVPLESMLLAAKFYIEKENLFVVHDDQKIRLVIERLGLNSITPFNPKEKIIEYMINIPDEGPLVSGTLGSFINSIGSRSPAPGGGSASAAIAAIGAALGCMSGFLTYGSKKFESLDSTMRRLILQLHDIKKNLMLYIDKDADAFNDYVAARKLPKSTKEEEARREKAMQDGLITAIQVPLTVIRIANKSWTSLLEMAHCCNVNVISDLQVASRSLEAGVWGAYYNVRINLKSITDETYKKKVEDELNAAIECSQTNCQEILQVLGTRSELSTSE